MARVLILGGTSEGRALAHALAHALVAQQSAFEIITSLAGATRHPEPLPGRVITGGFGGAQGLAHYLKAESIDAVVDATHPFAQRITDNAVAACAQSCVPYLRLDRPEWRVPQNTDVVFVPDVEEAARLVARTSASVLLTIGRKDLNAFAGLDTIKLVVRLIEKPKPEPQLVNVEYVFARPPFTLDGERDLLRANAIDTVVTKASGGEATRAKLDAAAQLGVRLVIVRRPPPPDAERVFSIEEACLWLARCVPRL